MWKSSKNMIVEKGKKVLIFLTINELYNKSVWLQMWGKVSPMISSHYFRHAIMTELVAISNRGKLLY